MTKKSKFEKGNSSLSNKKLKKVTSKRNSWKHQMYELEIAIAKESSNKKRDELIKLHNGLKKQVIWLAVLGVCFLIVLMIFGYFIWNSYNSESMSYTSSWIQERVISIVKI